MEQQVSFCIYDEFENGLKGYLADVLSEYVEKREAYCSDDPELKDFYDEMNARFEEKERMANVILAEVNWKKETLEEKIFEFLVTKLTMDPEMVLQLHRLESFSPACFGSDGTAVGQAMLDLLCSTEVMFVVIQKQRLGKNSFELMVTATHGDCVLQTVQKIEKGADY